MERSENIFGDFCLADGVYVKLVLHSSDVFWPLFSAEAFLFPLNFDSTTLTRTYYFSLTFRTVAVMFFPSGEDNVPASSETTQSLRRAEVESVRLSEIIGVSIGEWASSDTCNNLSEV